MSSQKVVRVIAVPDLVIGARRTFTVHWSKFRVIRAYYAKSEPEREARFHHLMSKAGWQKFFYPLFLFKFGPEFRSSPLNSSFRLWRKALTIAGAADTLPSRPILASTLLASCYYQYHSWTFLLIL